MRNKKAFTLIEMIIVIIIVGILATVLVPLLRGHVEDAKWAEGEAGLGTIATALRAYMVEHDAAPANLAIMGLSTDDLLGKYFVEGDYSFAVTTVNPMDYLITANAPVGLGWTVASKTLDHAGTLTP